MAQDVPRPALTTAVNNGKECRSSVVDNKAARKIRNHPPTSEMVLQSIKSLKKRNGATVSEICRHMETSYAVDTKKLKTYIARFFSTAVQRGLLENTGGSGDKTKFKIRKNENALKSELRMKVNRADAKKVAKKSRSHPSTSEMVLTSIKSLKMRLGASRSDICERMETAFRVDSKKLRPYISRFLNSSLKAGVLEIAGGIGDKTRFRMKQDASGGKIRKSKPKSKSKTEKITKRSPKKLLNAKVVKPKLKTVKQSPKKFSRQKKLGVLLFPSWYSALKETKKKQNDVN